MRKIHLIALLGGILSFCCKHATAQSAGAGDLHSTGTNSWLLHTPDDGRTSLIVAPATNGNWNWGAQTQFLNNGNTIFSGAIGIGAAPSALLHLSHPSPELKLTKTASKKAMITFANTGGNDFYFFTDPTTNDFKVRASGTDYDEQPRLRLPRSSRHIFLAESGGNVAIGTTTPSARLEVNQGATNNLAFVLSSSGAGWGSGMQLKNTDAGGSTYGIYSGSDGFFHIANAGKSVDNLLINPNGNVGIGTNKTDYKLNVNGTIRATEVRVESGWADFVFEPEYRLRPLSEVETHIQKHGHLPEVPTAKEVQQNGVDLGKTDALLLQKIEELTLYLIQQEKQLKVLQEDNALLKMQIEKLNDNKY